MPQLDTYHEAIKRALIKDGWIITHDPLYLPYGRRKVLIDLGAEAPLGAEKEGRKIAVEVKSFRSLSELTDLERAFGQLLIYSYALESQDPERVLYLALTERSFTTVFDDGVSLDLMHRRNFKALVFDPDTEEIVQWIE